MGQCGGGGYLHDYRGTLLGVSEPVTEHPLWGLLRIIVLCGTLLGLQLITATSWDLALDGEAGTLGGVAAMAVLLEWVRRHGA